MITVLHRGSDGSERVFEARSVVRYARDGEQECPALGDIVVRLSGDGIAQDETLALEKPFGAVFVMNRHGQTIAHYSA